MNKIPVCIDISHWQGYPDFDQVKASGVLGVIFKATQGTSYVDPNRATNCSRALRLGLAIATYFWLEPGDARAQAEFYLETIDPVPGERVIIDYEQDGCTLLMLREAVQTLLDFGKGLQITIYSGHLLKEQLGDTVDHFLAEHTDLWLAQYNDDESHISWPAGTWSTWTLWQYSESGIIPGIDGGEVDLDNFIYGDDEFLAWINPRPQEPEAVT